MRRGERRRRGCLPAPPPSPLPLPSRPLPQDPFRRLTFDCDRGRERLRSRLQLFGAGPLDLMGRVRSTPWPHAQVARRLPRGGSVQVGTAARQDPGASPPHVGGGSWVEPLRARGGDLRTGVSPFRVKEEFCVVRCNRDRMWNSTIFRSRPFLCGLGFFIILTRRILGSVLRRGVTTTLH